MGTYSDNTTADLTSKLSWSSASLSVGTVDSSSGLAQAVAVGCTVVTAKSGSVSGERDADRHARDTPKACCCPESYLLRGPVAHL